MSMRVLAVVPGQEPLRESSAAGLERRPARIDIRSARLPKGVAIDPKFPAVPIGNAKPGFSSKSMSPQEAQFFVVQAEVDAKDADELRAPRDSVQFFSNPTIEVFQQICPGDPARGARADVEAKLDCATLHANGLDGQKVAVAILDTGINQAHLRKRGVNTSLDVSVTWAPSGTGGTPGTHSVGHGTMCAFDVSMIAPKCSLFDYPILQSKSPGGSSVSGLLGDALQAYSHLMAFWAVSFGPTRSRYDGLVVSNSWGMYQLAWDFPAGHPGRYADNPNHPFNIIVGVLAGTGADIVFAAGNCGAPCPSSKCGGHTGPAIFGANAHADVLSLAGCDTNDLRVGYSSQGPAIAGMGKQKPDLTAYTHFLGSEAMGAGSADSGTSTACPVAAGCVAALRSRLPPNLISPAGLAQELRQTARQVVGSGWNADYGFGIINPVAVAKRKGLVVGV